MKRIILSILLAVQCSFSVAAEQPTPHWSFELKGGSFYPDLDNWSDYYGSKKTTQFDLALGRKFFRIMEVGLEAGYLSDQGVGYLPLHKITSGKVTYELVPMHFYVLVRGVFWENQWVVPYVGGGFSYFYYRESVHDQKKVTGTAHGTNVRGGLQFLLDRIDLRAADNLQRQFGVENTYLIAEAQITKVKKDSVKLGGVSYLFGLLFEF